MKYEEAKEKVSEELYPFYNNTKWAKKVVPLNEKYREEFEYDLFVKKYRIYDEDVKLYAKDNEFDTKDYLLSQLNLIFR